MFAFKVIIGTGCGIAFFEALSYSGRLNLFPFSVILPDTAGQAPCRASYQEELTVSAFCCSTTSSPCLLLCGQMSLELGILSFCVTYSFEFIENSLKWV